MKAETVAERADFDAGPAVLKRQVWCDVPRGPCATSPGSCRESPAPTAAPAPRRYARAADSVAAPARVQRHQSARPPLGHSTTAYTQDAYQEVMPGMQRDAARRFNELLQRGAPPPETAEGGA